MDVFLTKDTVTTADFFSAYPGVPAPTVYSKIRKLVKAGKIQVIGKGVYTTVPKIKYRPEVTHWMRRTADILKEDCIGVNFCITQKGANLQLEVDRANINLVKKALLDKGCKVLSRQEADTSPVPPEGYIIIGPYITDMPVMEEGNIGVPSLEKTIVDSYISGALTQFDFQKAAEAYAINYSSLLRYASRRGVGPELKAMVEGLDHSRLEMITSIQKFLPSIAVKKAWIFGSFARGEENPGSDLDLLVDYDKTNRLSLLKIIRYKLDMEQIINREVDLIEDGHLRSFAVESANRDKYLIYER